MHLRPVQMMRERKQFSSGTTRIHAGMAYLDPPGLLEREDMLRQLYN